MRGNAFRGARGRLGVTLTDAPRGACQCARQALSETRAGERLETPAPFLLRSLRMMGSTVSQSEQRLLEQVVSLARSLRDERERLARRLTDLEQELCVLASKLDGRPAVIALASRG